MGKGMSGDRKSRGGEAGEELRAVLKIHLKALSWTLANFDS